MTDSTVAERIVTAMRKFGETSLQVQEYLLTEITTALAEARREVWEEAAKITKSRDYFVPSLVEEFYRRSRSP